MFSGDQLPKIGNSAVKIIKFKWLAEAEVQWRKFEETGVCYVFQKFDWVTIWYEPIGTSEGYVPQLFSVRDDRETPI